MTKSKLQKPVHWSQFRTFGAHLSYTWYRMGLYVFQGDRSMLTLIQKNDRVVATETKVFGNILDFTVAAHVAGMAVVWQKDSDLVKLVGRKSNVDAFINLWPKRDDPWQLQQIAQGVPSMIAATRVHAPIWNSYIWQVRANPAHHGRMAIPYLEAHDAWLGLDKIRHKVVEVCPSLREWNTPPGAPEVVLKPLSPGGQRLGGAVWKFETYTTDEGREFLGL